MLLSRDDSGSGSKTEQSVALLEQKWHVVSSKMEERKVSPQITVFDSWAWVVYLPNACNYHLVSVKTFRRPVHGTRSCRTDILRITFVLIKLSFLLLNSCSVSVSSCIDGASFCCYLLLLFIPFLPYQFRHYWLLLLSDGLTAHINHRIVFLLKNWVKLESLTWDWEGGNRACRKSG